MRRALLLALVVAGMCVGVLVLAFSVSQYNVKGQRFGVSLADFLFMMSGYAALTLDPRPAVLDEQRIAYALGRYRPTTHWEVKKVAALYIARWQAAAIVPLARELEREDAVSSRRPWKSYGIVRALEEIGGAETLPVLLGIIERHRVFAGNLRSDPLGMRYYLVQALAKTRSPHAVDTLIGIQDKAKHLNPDWMHSLLSAIAETGYGAPFLLKLAHEAADAKELDRLIWPLARTRNPDAVEFLVGLFERPELAIRRSVRDALDQTAGPAAIPAVLRALKQTLDETLQSWLIQTILDDRDARGNPEVVSTLEPLLIHPALAWEARYALIRIGSSDAYGAILRQFDRLKPDELIRDMEYASSSSLPIVQRYLSSPDPKVRRMMLYKLPEMFVPGAASLIPPLLAEGDPSMRKAAREASLYMDRVLFWKSLTERLPERVGQSLFYAFRPTFFGAPLDHMLPLLRIVHAVGIALSALLACALLFGLARIVEPYRFDLFTAFLLLEGFVGDFLLLDFGRDPWLLIQIATGCHVALLAGVLLQPRERLPGELAGRFERLMGASVWLLMPLLLAFTTPVLAEALRYAFQISAWSLTLLGLLALVTALVVEQWALHWSLLPRSAIAEKRLAALLWFVLSILLLIAMFVWAAHLGQSGRSDQAIFTIIVAVPLLWLPLARGHAFKPGTKNPTQPGLLPALSERFAAADLGSLVALQPQAASWRGTAIRTAIVLATGVAAAIIAGWKGKALSMLLALIMAPVGAAAATLMIALLAPAWIIHLRNGYFRVGASRGGIALWDTGWRRRLVLPLALQRRLGGDPNSGDPERRRALKPDELAWIAAISEGQRASAGAAASATGGA